MVRTKQPKAQTLQSPPRTQEQLTRFLKLLGSIARAIKTGIFYRCPVRDKTPMVSITVAFRQPISNEACENQ